MSKGAEEEVNKGWTANGENALLEHLHRCVEGVQTPGPAMRRIQRAEGLKAGMTSQ